MFCVKFDLPCRPTLYQSHLSYFVFGVAGEWFYGSKTK